MSSFAVVALAFLDVGWWRQRPWYRRVIVIPASAAIAVTGVFWTMQRVAQAVR
jgi:O-antigen ligase